MSNYGLLQVGNEYEFTVKGIKEAAGNFVANQGVHKGATMYCHHFILRDDDGIEYKCQVCDPLTIQNYCNVMDTMGFKVKSFTRDIHTIDFISRDGKLIKPVAHLDNSDDVQKIMKEFNETPIQVVPEYDPYKIAALNGACLYFQNRNEGDDFGTLLEKADSLYEWLTTKQ